jgi:cysteine-rich repeat protein
LTSTNDDSTATDLFCGDGILSAGEECDDGGQSAGDGCSPECFKEFRRVFVTSEQFSGNMGGVSGAHALCQAAAAAAGLTGTFSAWLSDSTHSPESDFIKSAVPYLLVDDTVVSNNWEQLISGQLMSGIYVTEKGGAPLSTSDPCMPEGLVIVWTNTNVTGKQDAAQLSCNQWAAGGDQGSGGIAGGFDSSWSVGCYMPCSTMAPLYCFEQ